MISTITLSHLVPRVFRGSENEPPICDSRIWGRDRVDFARGEFYMIEAESGTGKSSLCSFAYGDRDDYDGKILFDGKDVRELSINQWCDLRRTSLAYLPQEMRLFAELTVMDNILVKNRLTDYFTTPQIMAMLESLELSHKADQPAGLLSIGQQQRVAIIRSLCQPFDFLLVDEPVSHLDARNNAAVASMIVSQAQLQGASIIATSVGNQLALPSFTLLKL